jgi:hypothetical protein
LHPKEVKNKNIGDNQMRKRKNLPEKSLSVRVYIKSNGKPFL